jgi:hypothetical protein
VHDMPPHQHQQRTAESPGRLHVLGARVLQLWGAGRIMEAYPAAQVGTI